MGTTHVPLLGKREPSGARLLPLKYQKTAVPTTSPPGGTVRPNLGLGGRGRVFEAARGKISPPKPTYPVLLVAPVMGRSALTPLGEWFFGVAQDGKLIQRPARGDRPPAVCESAKAPTHGPAVGPRAPGARRPGPARRRPVQETFDRDLAASRFDLQSPSPRAGRRRCSTGVCAHLRIVDSQPRPATSRPQRPAPTKRRVDPRPGWIVTRGKKEKIACANGTVNPPCALDASRKRVARGDSRSPYWTDLSA